MNLTVTIAGGGLSGLMLARILHVYGIPAIIYEAEPSPEARRQGGQLDIHESSGQYALQEAGLSDEFRAIIHRGAAQRAYSHRKASFYSIGQIMACGLKYFAAICDRS